MSHVARRFTCLDHNLQDGIDLIDAAYEVFIQGTAEEELKSYIFELLMNLEPARIREYMKIIADEDGHQTCQQVMEYIVLVLGQFLQIMVSVQMQLLFSHRLVHKVVIFFCLSPPECIPEQRATTKFVLY